MQEVLGSNPGIFSFNFFLVYFCALLLRQRFRQHFLDSPWRKIMPGLVKSRLQNFICELDFIQGPVMRAFLYYEPFAEKRDKQLPKCKKELMQLSSIFEEKRGKKLQKLRQLCNVPICGKKETKKFQNWGYVFPIYGKKGLNAPKSQVTRKYHSNATSLEVFFMCRKKGAKCHF